MTAEGKLPISGSFRGARRHAPRRPGSIARRVGDPEARRARVKNAGILTDWLNFSNPRRNRIDRARPEKGDRSPE
jgi:hypothetical protein